MTGTGTSSTGRSGTGGNAPPGRSHLVIGYGNDLRGDDGAGRRVGEHLQESGAAAEILLAHQLLPEHAEAIAGAEIVTFIDVYPAGREHAPVELYRVTPADRPTDDPRGAHHCRPEDLLAMARDLYGRGPVSWLLAIPAYDFSLGESLSPGTDSAVADAVVILQNHLSFLANTPIKDL